MPVLKRARLVDMTSEQKQLAYLTRRVASLEKSLEAILANQGKLADQVVPSLLKAIEDHDAKFSPLLQ